MTRAHRRQRRQWFARVARGGLWLATIAALPRAYGSATEERGTPPDAGLASWLAMRLAPADGPLEADLLDAVVARHVAANPDAAAIDRALRLRAADPFLLGDGDARADAALGAILAELLDGSASLRAALGMPEGLRLEASCGLARAQ